MYYDKYSLLCWSASATVQDMSTYSVVELLCDRASCWVVGWCCLLLKLSEGWPCPNWLLLGSVLSHLKQVQGLGPFSHLSHSFLSSPLKRQCWHGSSVGCTSNLWSGGSGFNPCWVRHHSFVETDHSRVILYLPLIQERQLSVSGEKIHTSTG